MKNYSYLFSFLFMMCFAHAQTSFTVKASKNTICIGEPFDLIYTIKYDSTVASIIGDDVVFPKFNGFNEVSTSKSSSINIINNKTNAEISYVKTLIATKKGSFKIPSALLRGQKSLRSNVLVIKVISGQKNVPSPGAGNNSYTNKKNTPDTFVKWILEKNNPYLHEGINLKLRFYSKDIDVIRSIQEVKPPKFEGLTVHLIENKEDITIEVENINGEEYAYADLQQWIAFSQTQDKIEIGSAQVELASFSSLYGNDTGYVNSDPISIIPKPLPINAPKNFNGAVGQFQIKSTLDKNKLKMGESASYEIELIGNGNFDLIKLPEVILNDSLEVYTPKERQNFSATTNGLKGKIAIEYVLVPESNGNFTVSPISFSYFDPVDGAYKSIESEKYILSVFGNKNSIKTNENNAKVTNTTIDSWQKNLKENLFLILFLFLFFVFVIFMYYVWRKRELKEILKEETQREEFETPTYAIKQSNEKDKLDELRSLVEANNSTLYFEKQESFINSWLLSKTGLPQSKLTTDSAKEYFLSNGFEIEKVNELEKTINKSKEAKYASVLNKNSLTLIEEYQRLITIINQF